ncbi:SMK killer toxin resistance protein [Ophidiomyces ophidiicola]|nr:SMK killer toxin resistance protein [Ophidiomyces ophidiicola]KAI1943043.1 SMK killer toxin resistance protein [Ophidiomyces ophidiicola]
MASFLTDLWSSIFTPGTTPTLLLATNATFAALQVLLLALLYATHSIHFIVLSGLCAALWWSINWFAAELEAVKKKEALQRNKGTAPPAGVHADAAAAATTIAATANTPVRQHMTMRPPGAIIDTTTDSDTETELLANEKDATTTTITTPGAASMFASSVPASRKPPAPLVKRDSTPSAPNQLPGSTAAASSNNNSSSEAKVRQRHTTHQDNSSGYASTDSEWEKVEGGAH